MRTDLQLVALIALAAYLAGLLTSYGAGQRAGRREAKAAQDAAALHRMAEEERARPEFLRSA